MSKSSLIAEYCLNKYWNSSATDIYGGWDIGSPAHRYAMRWTKKNIRRFSTMSKKQIYSEYLRTLVQE